MTEQKELEKKVKVDSWCHGSDCWAHYSYFDSRFDAETHINSKGYDPRYFNIAQSPYNPKPTGE